MASIRNYRDAAHAVYRRYDGMLGGCAVNNALFVAFGLLIGGRDFSRVIGETAAIGFDNDCTGATSGSIVGTVLGKSNIPLHWYKIEDIGRVRIKVLIWIFFVL